MHYHDSRPLELPSWPKSSPYKLICIRESGQAIINSCVLESFRAWPGLSARMMTPYTPFSFPPPPDMNDNHRRVRGSDPLVAVPSQTSS